MDVIITIYSAVFVAFVVSTMLNVGLGTTVEHLTSVVRNVWLIGGALLASLVLAPLVGWGIAEIFPLEAYAFVAVVLLACSPGAPLGVALTTMARADLVVGAATMSILAMIGSVTTPLTTELILSQQEIDDAGGVSIDVGELILSIVTLQVLPFTIGMLLRRWVPDQVDGWQPWVKKIATGTLLVVLLGMIVGGISEFIDLIGTWVIPATVLMTLAFMTVGAVLAPPPDTSRQTAALITSARNVSPVLLIAFAAFPDDLENLIPAIIVVLITMQATQITVAAWLGKRNVPETIDAPEHAA